MSVMNVTDPEEISKAFNLLKAIRKINEYEISREDGERIVIRFENDLEELNDLPYDDGSVTLEDILIKGAEMLEV